MRGDQYPPSIRSDKGDMLSLRVLPHITLSFDASREQTDLPNNHRVSLTTKASRKPSGADANFLERMIQEVQLPVHEIYAPRLKLCVRDVRLGG